MKKLKLLMLVFVLSITVYSQSSNNITISTSASSGGSWSGTNPKTWTATSSSANVSVTEIQSNLNSGISVIIYTGASGSEYGDITLSTNISKTSGTNATITLRAYRSITINGNISSSYSALNIVFHSRYGANDEGTDSRVGSVWLPQGYSITTNGGSITIGGGLDPSVGFAVGTTISSGENNALMRGITINGNITAAGGSIIFNGMGMLTTSSRGVSIRGDISTTGSGTIYIKGYYGNLGSSSDGVAIGDSYFSGGDPSGSVISQNGNITIYGSCTASSRKCFNLNNGSILQTTGTGNVSITASSTGTIVSDATSTMLIGGTTTFTGYSGSDITFNNSNNDFTGSVSISGAGAITLTDKNSLSLISISATGAINISAGCVSTGDLTLNNAVTTTNTTSSAVILIAGKYSSPGTSSGGDIIINSGSVSFGTGGTAKLFTGSIAGSTGITGLSNYSSSRVYYSCDETSTLSPTPGAGLYVIYRQADPMPVELISFTALKSQKNVQLNWQTATEVNNYGFEVERKSNDKSQMSDEWKKIGFVEGYGNSNSPKEYKYVDANPFNGTVKYRLKQIDNDGSFSYSPEVEVEMENVPTEFALYQNYPNPFSAKRGSASGGNPFTRIQFQVPSVSQVTLKVYDILGKEIATLVDEEKPAGIYAIDFDGSSLSSGIYFYQLTTGSSKGQAFVQTLKMTIIK